MWNLLLVMAGGAVGSASRYGLSRALSGYGSGWPYATLIANIVGGLLMGVLMGLLTGPLKGGADTERLRLFFGVGILGGFTTFSAFSLETVMMLERRDYMAAAVYVAASVFLSLAGVGVGLWLVRKGLGA